MRLLKVAIGKEVEESVVVNGATFKPEKPDPCVPVIAVEVDQLLMNQIQVESRKDSTDVLLHNVPVHDIDSRLSVVSQ